MKKQKQTLVVDNGTPLRLKSGLKAGLYVRKAGEKPVEY